jgi:tetratricopeptide (TPR) repeat protein
MYNKLISKNINHFGPEGVIMYSKSCDYYNINPVSIEDIEMFYQLLKSDEPLPQYVHKQAHLSCCLFYLSKNNPMYQNIFVKELIHKLSKKDEINDTNLFLIYNIIEFDQRYLHSEKERLQYLLTYLEKFSNIKKTVENFLLYKYYRGLLKYLIGEMDDAYTENFEIIISLDDYVKDKTKYVDFIRLKNELFKVQLDLNKHVKEEYFEQYCFMKELFDKVKVENKKLGVKLGFCLYTILCRQNKYNECIPLLMEMKKIVKNETFSGVKTKISIDYYLAIASRIGYIGVLIGDKKSIEYAVKKIEKILNIIEQDKNDRKLASIYNAYSFVISILNVNLDKYENRLKEKASMFRGLFLPNDINSYPKTGYFIINEKNRGDIVINLNAINNMDYSLSEFSTKLTDYYKSIVVKKQLMLSNQFLTFIVGIYDIINRLTESYCTDNNVNKRNDYINKIISNANVAFNYISSHKEDEPLLNTDFVKGIIINMQSTLIHCYFYMNSLDTANKYIKFFDGLFKDLNIKENTTSYELVNKIKGDYWFKKGDYSASISYYENALKTFNNNDPRKAIVYFNLGCSYYMNNNKKSAVDNYNKCINAFRVFEYEKKTFNILVRQDIISKKVNLAKYLVRNMGVSN